MDKLLLSSRAVGVLTTSVIYSGIIPGGFVGETVAVGWQPTTRIQVFKSRVKHFYRNCHDRCKALAFDDVLVGRCAFPAETTSDKT